MILSYALQLCTAIVKHSLQVILKTDSIYKLYTTVTQYNWR